MVRESLRPREARRRRHRPRRWVSNRARAALEVDSAGGASAMGSVVIEAREVTVRLDGDIDASRVAEIASALRGLR